MWLAGKHEARIMDKNRKILYNGQAQRTLVMSCCWRCIHVRLVIRPNLVQWNLTKLNTSLNQIDFTVPSTKCLCNWNLCKQNTCLNWTNSSVPKEFGLDRFYCIWLFPYNQYKLLSDWMYPQQMKLYSLSHSFKPVESARVAHWVR